MKLKILVDSISTFSPILPLVIGVRKRPGLVWYYILLGLVFNLLAGKILKGTPDAKVVANIYVVAEFFVVSYFFFEERSAKMIWLVFLSVPLLIFCCYNTISNGVSNFNFLSAALFSFLYIVYCIVSLYSIMLDARIINVFGSFRFLATVAVLIYFSGMFFAFSVGNYFRAHEVLWGMRKYTLMGQIWIINSFCNIVQALIFSWAFYKVRVGSATYR